MIDALRGIAALWVACAHIFGSGRRFYELIPTPLAIVIQQASLGVAIFFVLSGFAIAWSVRGGELGGAGVGRFMLRRSLRLDPPYWATIALACLTLSVSNMILHDRVAALPSVTDVLWHLVYLPDIVGVQKILFPFWTLFLEMQFYVLFVLQLWLAQRVARRVGWRRAALMVFVPGILFSLVASTLPAEYWHGFCANMWCYYALGVCAAWVHERTIPGRWMWVFLAGSLVAFLVRPSAFAGTAIATVTLILVASRFDRLGHWLSHPVLQYLGRISYSLYLVHPLTGQRFANLAFRVFGESPIATAASCLLGLAGAIAGAHVLWWSVERPSLWMARRIRLRPVAG